MKKIILLLFIFVFSTIIKSQSIYSKSEIRLKGTLVIFSKMANGTSVTYQKNNKTRSVTKTMNVTQEIITVEDKVTILNKFSPKCAVFTKAELEQDSLENDIPTTDLRIEKTSEVKTFLGYNCEKTVIRYKIKGFNYETAIWCTKEIQVPKPEIKSLESMKRNSLFVAMQSLEGFVLKTETLMSVNGGKTVITVTELSTKEIDDSVFDVDPSSCKEPMNLKEYKKELLRQKASMRTGSGF